MTQDKSRRGSLPIPGKDAVLVVPLGGTERVGMNATLVGYGGKWIMIDAGATFAGSDDDEAADFGKRHGGEVQQIIPDFRMIKDILPRLEGIFVTHSHEDHIGALPTIFSYSEAWAGLQDVKLYAGEYARGIIRRKLEEVGAKPKISRIQARKITRAGPFEVMPISITHSAPETFMLAIATPVGMLMFGSDSKLDPHPVIGKATDTNALVRLGQAGVLAYLGDSTNAPHAGRSTSELEVSQNIADIMARRSGRVIVSTFASNLARVAGVVAAAGASGRRIGSAGRTIVNNVETAIAVNLTDARRFRFDEPRTLAAADRRKVAYVCTGTQAEEGSALMRAAEDLERGRISRNSRVILEPGDLVIHSARTIPGNEMNVKAMFDTMRRMGIEVMDPENAQKAIHASGHGKRSEIEEMYKMLKPRFAIPVHGHGLLTDAHHDIARSARSVRDVVTPKEGEILRVDQESMTILGRLEIGQLALLSIGGRNSGETRLVSWSNTPKIDMRRKIEVNAWGQPKAERRFPRKERPEAASSPAFAR